tara:strand:+ start:178 stop:1431 length:1254 start_codon:yes stop_codon:yes gene_type:complete
MAQTKPKAAQFYGVSGDGTAGQVLISDGNGGMFWGANTENYTVSWNTPTGQSLTYIQPTPQSSSGSPGDAFPSTTFTATKSGEILSGTATIAGLPTGITATQSLSGTGADNILTVTLAGVFPGADSLNTDLTLSGLTITAPPQITVDYLVVAGGGGGNGSAGGGGGAGGLRTSYGSATGGGGSAESSLSLTGSTNYTVTVGAGGIGGTPANSRVSTNGNNSIFSTITSTGGGYGSSNQTGAGNDGGSGGGGSTSGSSSIGLAVTTPVIQGYNAGSNGNGGGAGGLGTGGSGGRGGNGGIGLQVNIDGNNYYYAGGGGGSADTGQAGGTGGLGGGGNGGVSSTSNGQNGTNNLGGGGGGAWNAASGMLGGNGGSGVVILRYSNTFTVTIGAGLTGTTTTDGSDKVTTLTAGTGNIQLN